MEKMPDEVIRFFEKQRYVVVSTIDGEGRPHTACKGIVKIVNGKEVHLVDLYTGMTYRNLKSNPRISITAVDEHRFKGYCLKGEARLEGAGDVIATIERDWQGRISSRITDRIIKNVQGERGHPRQPEAHLPKPKAVIVMEVEELVDLTPKHIK